MRAAILTAFLSIVLVAGEAPRRSRRDEADVKTRQWLRNEIAVEDAPREAALSAQMVHVQQRARRRHTESPVAWLVKGCPNEAARTSNASVTSGQVARVQCCDFDGRIVRAINGTCLETNPVPVSYNVADLQCNGNALRLCRINEVDNAALTHGRRVCDNKCNLDSFDVWAAVAPPKKTAATSPPPAAQKTVTTTPPPKKPPPAAQKTATSTPPPKKPPYLATTTTTPPPQCEKVFRWYKWKWWGTWYVWWGWWTKCT